MDLGINTKVNRTSDDSRTVDEIQIVLRYPRSNRNSKKVTTIVTCEWEDKMDQPTASVTKKETNSYWNERIHSSYR